MTMKLNLKKKFSQSRSKTQVQPWKARDPQLAARYEAAIGKQIYSTELPGQQNIDNLTENIYGAPTDTAPATNHLLIEDT